MVGEARGEVGSGPRLAGSRWCQVKIRFLTVKLWNVQHASHSPIEASDSRDALLGVSELELERLGVDGVDDGTDDVGGVLGDSLKERLEPTLRDLAVRVKKGQDLSCGLSGAQQPPPDQTHPLPRPEDLHLAPGGEVRLQRVCQVLESGAIIDQDDLAGTSVSQESC